MESKSFSFWKYLPKVEALDSKKTFVMESKSFSFWKDMPKAEALDSKKYIKKILHIPGIRVVEAWKYEVLQSETAPTKQMGESFT
jgi:hypothetical protein